MLASSVMKGMIFKRAVEGESTLHSSTHNGLPLIILVISSTWTEDSSYHLPVIHVHVQSVSKHDNGLSATKNIPMYNYVGVPKYTKSSQKCY